MIQLRPFSTLGAFRNEWLNAHHHFSFGGYHDPERMGLGRLRVWNDDEVAPGTGFDPHPHRDMEIVTYIREGAITHRDNLGNEGRTEAGDVQVMHAGTGITHAEYNREKIPTRLFQIWIQPDRRGVAPGWLVRFGQRSALGLRNRRPETECRCRCPGRHLDRRANHRIVPGTWPSGLSCPGQRIGDGEWDDRPGARRCRDLRRSVSHHHRDRSDRDRGRGRGCLIPGSLDVDP
jgi:hypothetical protein